MMMKLKGMCLYISLLVMVNCLAVVFGGCSTTHQTRSVKTSGFLDDYSQMKEGEGDEAQLIYINPSADFSSYDKVMIDSVNQLDPQ